MTAKNFFISDFTEKNYSRILRAILQNYRFVSYKNGLLNHKKVVILRHDVDFSPQRALALAKIEKSLSVKATYCILLGSSFYNPFERKIRDIIVKICNLGHDLGLHFDCASYRIHNFKQLASKVNMERMILQNLIGREVKVISFHNPLKIYLHIKQHTIACLINAYHPDFIKNYKYISDSNGYWRHDRLQDILKNPNPDQSLHILLHPEWWQKRELAPWQRILRCAKGRMNNALLEYNTMLFSAKRKNIGLSTKTGPAK